MTEMKRFGNGAVTLKVVIIETAVNIAFVALLNLKNRKDTY